MEAKGTRAKALHPLDRTPVLGLSPESSGRAGEVGGWGRAHALRERSRRSGAR